MNVRLRPGDRIHANTGSSTLELHPRWGGCINLVPRITAIPVPNIGGLCPESFLILTARLAAEQRLHVTRLRGSNGLLFVTVEQRDRCV